MYYIIGHSIQGPVSWFHFPGYLPSSQPQPSSVNLCWQAINPQSTFFPLPINDLFFLAEIQDDIFSVDTSGKHVGTDTIIAIVIYQALLAVMFMVGAKWL